MKVLDRYLSLEFLRNLLLITGSFIALFLIIDFFEKIRMFLSNGASSEQMALHFIFRIPMVLSQSLPASVLLASLITCGTLSRHSEIVAMKANGISLYRISLPILIIATLVSVFVFLLSEWVTPFTNERAEYIRLVEVQKRPSLGSFKQDQIWYRGRKGIYNFNLLDPKQNRLHGVAIHYLDRDMNLQMRLNAEWGEWQKGRWVFHNVLIARFPVEGFPVVEKVSLHVADLPETPEDFKIVQKDVEVMGYAELKRYIHKLRSEGYDATRYETDLQGKIAFPWVGIILAFIGIAFSLRSERSGGIAQSIGAGLVIGFSYWLIFAFGLSLGRSGTLPPLASAWLANGLFALASLWLFRRIQT